MRTRDKISILKKMKYLINEEVSFGFCYAYELAIGNEPKEHNPESVNKVVALGLNPPKTPYSGDWWYDFRDKTVRIRAINRLIKKLEL